LTYPIEEIDAAREADWQQHQAIEKKKQLEKPEKKVRPDWSPATQSLASFLAENENFAKKIHIVPDGQPYLIDLFDKVETGEE
jgi:hypothetical protein